MVSKHDKAVAKVHGVRMKGIMIGGTVDGQAKGLSPIECLKEFNKKKLKRLGDRVPLIMVELTEKGSEIATKASKSTKESTDPQENNLSKPSNDVLNVMPIQVVFS